MANEDDLTSWAKRKNKPGDVEPEDDDDEVALEEPAADDETEGNAELRPLIELVKENLRTIEKSAGACNASDLLGDDELDQGDTDGIVDTLESLEEDLSDEVSGIDFRTAREVATAIEDELEDVTTEVLAAWLFRAGQLV